MGDKAQGASAEGAFRVYIPLAGKGSGPTPPPPPPVGGAGHESLAFMPVVSQWFFERMIGDSRQGRAVLNWSEKLEKVACTRVVSMAVNGWRGHVDPQGKGPDWYARQGGVLLPSWYWDERKSQAENYRANHIESLAYGGPADWTDQKILDWSWEVMSDPADLGHYLHIMGQETFAAQTEVGICAVRDPDSLNNWYVSILSCPPAG